jgi:hypothetical protein
MCLQIVLGKIGNSFLLCKLEKEASKKEKIAKVLKPQKLKRIKNKKNIGRNVWISRQTEEK